METDSLEKVLERMAVSEDTKLVIKRDLEGKMRVTSTLLGFRMLSMRFHPTNPFARPLP